MGFDIDKYIGINQLVEDVDIINNPEAYMIKSKNQVKTPYEKYLDRRVLRKELKINKKKT